MIKIINSIILISLSVLAIISCNKENPKDHCGERTSGSIYNNNVKSMKMDDFIHLIRTENNKRFIVWQLSENYLTVCQFNSVSVSAHIKIVYNSLRPVNVNVKATWASGNEVILPLTPYNDSTQWRGEVLLDLQPAFGEEPAQFASIVEFYFESSENLEEDFNYLIENLTFYNVTSYYSIYKI